MRFSEHFGITPTQIDDWFDVDLTVDTKLFLDPFLLLGEEGTASRWANAHSRLLDHFTRCYELVAKGAGSKSLSSQVARSLLTFPEPEELGLGYTSASRQGSGSGSGFAQRMMDAIATAIAAGITRPEHIEEIGILNEGIGADRISDAACNILKADLIAYTMDVASAHGVPVKNHPIRNAAIDLKTGRWRTAQHRLPTTPDGKPILLVPKKFLDSLPTLNASDWFDSTFNADIRRDMNVRVGDRVSKRKIAQHARRHPDRIRRWADHVHKNGLGSGYDFDDDPLGIAGWQEAGKQFAAGHPLSMGGHSPTSTQELASFVHEVLRQFRHFVEQQGGWKLLWHGKDEKPEEAAQLLLLGMARQYCRGHGVELDREVEMGRGPVDFKISRGPAIRVLIEVKKLHNGKFWNGLEKQLPTYMNSDQCDTGILVAVQYRSGGISDKRSKSLSGEVQRVAQQLGLALTYELIDARRPSSASKL